MPALIDGEPETRRGVAVIADDLTGALDAAAPFSAHGFTTQVIPSSAIDARSGLGADVRILCSDTRDLSPFAAADKRDRCIDLVLETPAMRLGLKIDSLLRGCIAADIRAVVSRLEQAGPIFLAPALPEQGRITRDSRVVVNGVDLDDTESYVRFAAPTVRALAEQTGFAVRVVGLDELRSDGFGDQVVGVPHPRPVIYVFDAETDADLRRVVEIGVASSVALWVGSAGLFHQLALELSPQHGTGEDDGSAPALPTLTTQRDPRILVVSGSASARSSAQLEALVADGAVACYAEDPSDVSRLIRELRAALATGAVAAIGVRRPADETLPLDPKHARVIAAVVSELRGYVDGIVVVGGETSRQSFKQLGVLTLHVTASLDGGMAAGLAEPGLNAPQAAFPFVSKAGSFGDDEALIRAVIHLQRQLEGAQ
jgi:uncharacterized protein YgbK (DUF1537 family)